MKHYPILSSPDVGFIYKKKRYVKNGIVEVELEKVRDERSDLDMVRVSDFSVDTLLVVGADLSTPCQPLQRSRLETAELLEASANNEASFAEYAKYRHEYESKKDASKDSPKDASKDSPKDIDGDSK